GDRYTVDVVDADGGHLGRVRRQAAAVEGVRDGLGQPVPFGDPGGAGAGLHPRLLHQVDDHGFDDVDLGGRVAEVPVPGPVQSGGHAFLHDHERGRLSLPGPVTEDGYAE